MFYHDRYSWSHEIDAHVIAHNDGACSLMIEWAGMDAELLSSNDKAHEWQNLYQLLHSIGEDYCVEFHNWHDADTAIIDQYAALADQHVRGGALGKRLRRAYADHLRPLSMSHRVALVVTRLPKKTWLKRAKGFLKRVEKDAAQLRLKAQALMAYLPEARLLGSDEYIQYIEHSFQAGRVSDLGTRHETANRHLMINERVVHSKPELVDGCLSNNGQYTKVLLLHLHPDANPGFFEGMSAFFCRYHISHIVKPMDTRHAITQTEKASEHTEGFAGTRGKEHTSKGLRELADFRRTVVDNNLGIFSNTFVMHLHHESLQTLQQLSRDLMDWFTRSNAVIKADDYVQLPFFRAAMPGQGYLAALFRPDHTWQVANLLPVQRYRRGDENPNMIRLGQSGQIIGFNYEQHPVAHAFTVAITRGGKGVDKVCEIMETFTTGTDWYICEVGGSYQWIVEAFGGSYTRIDPDKNIVNPLPPYCLANYDGELPLNAKVAGSTIQALAFLLNGGKTELDFHQDAAASMALQMLYANYRSDVAAPTLPDFLAMLEDTSYLERQEQVVAAKAMAANLHSFLETTAGRKFSAQDNLVLSEGITGIDLKGVEEVSPELLKFYLVFISLRFQHMALMRRTPARILLDEMHIYVRVAPEIVGKLVSVIARTGGKEDGWIDVVTQGISELDAIEREVINSMQVRSLLYRADDWDAIAERIGMGEGPLMTWKYFENPLRKDYRPGIKSIGDDYYNVHLTFPDEILALADTQPKSLTLKDEIATVTSDPVERLQLFKERKRA